MRRFWSVLAGMLLAGGLWAQQPPQAQLQPPANLQPPAGGDKLDTLLQRWEQEMVRVQGLAAELTVSTVDKTHGSTDVMVGTARYMKPNLVCLEMVNKKNPQVYKKFVCSGNFIYDFLPQNKVVRVYEQPPAKPDQVGVGDDNLVSFLFGTKAADIKSRYDLKFVKEDQWYYYVEVLPKLPADKQEFQRARLVFNISTMLPRQIWREHPNGNEETWDLPNTQVNPKMDRMLFAAPTNLPAGWNWEKVPRADAVPRSDVPPRVVRPNQQ